MKNWSGAKVAKKKNKGFSLIEVVIAVAVLGLLITPILTQIVQTSNTSRRAKERQAAVENAEYITNFIQRTDKSELDKSSSDGVSDINITGKNYYANVICKMVDTSGNDIKTVTYNATVYNLDNVKLGPKLNEYKRKAVLDDLNNNILAEGYTIVYDSSKYNESLKSKGYKLTNEGSIVRYNSMGTVSEVVCEKRDNVYLADAYKYVNPNKVSLGFIQDLDSTKVAIIQGIASNFDSQVSDELFSQKMNNLQMINEDGWKDQLGAASNIFANDTSSVRLLYVSINAKKDISGKIEYYEVLCDACYYENYSVAKAGGGSQSFTAKLRYNVFSKKFYTTKSPDIYLIYEPYVSDTKQNLYAYNDFIEVYNDEDTKDSKLYLIKPETNQLSVAWAKDEEGNVTTPNPNLGYVDGNFYNTKHDGVLKPVNININMALATGEAADTKNAIQIYSNIDVNYTKEGWKQFSTDDTVRAGSVDSTGLTALKGMPFAYHDVTSVSNYPDNHLHMLSEDTNLADRLFTVSVLLEPVDGKMDDVRYTAGKGVN